MSANKYGNVLTIILIVLIVLILGAVVFLAYNYIINPRSQENKNIAAIEEFDRNVEEQETDKDKEEKTDQKLEVEETEHSDEQTSTSGQVKKKTYYEGFVMLGYITIPKTNVKQPILDKATADAIMKAVAVLYPSNAQLNQPGNVVIIGHNFRDGRFFANNKKLSVGDRLSIKDSTGTELTYTIYEKFETTPEDTSFYNRNTNGAIEVTLSTCTDDGNARTIILARVEQ